MSISNSLQKNTLLTAILLVISTAAISETSYNKEIYSAFINRDMQKWEKVILDYESTHSANTTDKKLELISYYYGYIGYLLGVKQYDKAEKFIDNGEKLIKEVLHENPDNATALSFKGSFLGFKIGVCKYKAVFLQSDSKECVNKSLKIDPQNTQALMDKGNILYYAPRVFGGNKKEALAYFLKAKSIFEQNNDIHQNWMYLNLLTIIASAYDDLGNQQAAKNTYNKILALEPNIIWVKNDLFPKLLEKMKS